MNSTLLVEVDNCSIYVRYINPITGTLMVGQLVISIIGNGLVAVVITTNKTFHKPQYFCLLSLAIASMIVTVTTQTLDMIHIFNIDDYPFSPKTTVVWNSLFYSSLTASAFNLLLMTGERFISIRWPLRHIRLNSVKQITGPISIVWCYVLVTFVVVCVMQDLPDYGVYDYLTPLYFQYLLLSLNLFLPMIGSFALHFRIFRIAKKRQSQIKRTNFFIDSEEERGECQMNLYWNRMKCIRHLKANLKTAKLFLKITFVFLFCWAPYIISDFYMSEETTVMYSCLGDYLDTFFAWLTYWCCAINVFIFSSSSKKFRKGYRQLHQKFKRQYTCIVDS